MTEDLHAGMLRARRAGHTVAFVDADVTVGGKVPHFLLMPPTAADKFQREHPEAQRLTLEELKTFIESKYGGPANNETELTNGQGS